MRKLEKIFLTLLILTAVGFLFSSCAKKHYKENVLDAASFERRGMKNEANNEYIRAMRRSSDPKEKARLAEKIADNYRLSRRFNDAVKYYLEAIKLCNANKMIAPYKKLARLYIKHDQIGNALNLLNNAKQENLDYILQYRIEIHSLLSEHFFRKEDWKQASLYTQKLLDDATKARDKLIVKTASERMKIIKEKKI